MRRAWLFLLGWCCACNCGGGSLGGAAVGFTVSGDLVDFGRVLEGAQESRPVAVVSAGRVDLTLDVSTSGPPFSAPTSVTVPAGGQADVAVVFTAGSTVATGTLQLSNRGKSVSVPLRGEGVRPLHCVPSAPCRISTFDLGSSTCVESTAPDGATCTSLDQCLDNTVCLGGACVGTPRNCDDANVCTEDACSSTQGCVHLPIVCSPPNPPCRTCDPKLGCGAAPVPDGLPCGPIDCVTANLCIAGQCDAVATPDGFVCAPGTPCRDVGRCQNKQCVLPDAGALVPAFQATLPRSPSRVDDLASALVAFHGNLYWIGCDAGCALESFTFNGFPRFSQTLPDAGARWLVGVTDAGVIVETDGGIEAYDPALGGPLWSWSAGDAGVTSIARTALLQDGTVFALFTNLDSGVESLVVRDPDGGVTASAVGDGGTQSLIAVDRDGGAFTYDPLRSALPGVPSVLVSDGVLLEGATWSVALDGGAVRGPLVPDAGMPWYPDERIALAAGAVGTLIERACMPPLIDPCADADKTSFLVRADLASGAILWWTQAAPAGFSTRFEEAVLVVGGGALVLTQTQLDAGSEVDLQYFDTFGRRGYACRLPPPGELAGAAFDNGLLYVLAYRDPVWELEAYDAGVPLETSGWPLRNGVSGTRQER